VPYPLSLHDALPIWDGRIEDKRRILSDEVVPRGMPHLNRPVLDGAQYLQRRDEFAGRIGADLESAAGQRADTLSHHGRHAKDRVDRKSTRLNSSHVK